MIIHLRSVRIDRLLALERIMTGFRSVMPAIELVNRSHADSHQLQNPLPGLLHTPAGLAMIEIQGSVHTPAMSSDTSHSVEVGRLEFPLLDASKTSTEEGSWMKKAHLYIGKHQVLNGEVKKLAKPLAVIVKATEAVSESTQADTSSHNSQSDKLDIIAVIKYKIIFSSRPEPVSQVNNT